MYLDALKQTNARLSDKKNNSELTENRDDLIDFDIPEWALPALINRDESGLSDEDQQKLNVFVNNVIKEYGNANFMLGDIEGEDNLGFRPTNDIDGLGSNVYRLYIDPTINEDMQTMIQNNGTSMSNKSQPTGNQSSGVPVGTQITAGLNESAMNLFEKLDKELEAFSIHHNKLKIMTEERKTTSQIINARVGNENEKNFKKDFNNSDTKEIVDAENELEWNDQQTEVNDSQKLGNDIEKQEIKSADMKSGDALKNVGNSTNDKGDEVPKRNFTSDEQEEVNLSRNGMHSFVYDNEPDKRFEDRMKADMGDEIYELRQKQLNFKGKAPMYNKDPQPIENTTAKKVQYDKEQTGWNERMGIGNEKSLKESIVTGRYIDALGKRRLIEFRLSDAKFVENADDLFELDFSGLGNTYHSKSIDNKVIVNETVVRAIRSNKYYTNGKTVVGVKNKIKNINETKENENKSVVNEEMNKIKHLLDYKPDSFVNTNNIKKNRGF